MPALDVAGVALQLTLVLVAEADGNRTRPPAATPGRQ
jgi:hypothetical protein